MKSITITSVEIQSLQQVFSGSAYDRIAGIQELEKKIKSGEPPIEIIDGELIEPLKNVVSFAFAQETEYVNTLFLNGRATEAATRLQLPIGITAIAGIVSKFGESGIELRNNALFSQRLNSLPMLAS